jgi:hypothetical protein
MKTILLKTALFGLASATAMNGLALASPAQTLPTLGNLPLYFTAVSPGQASPPAQFIARGGDCQFLIAPAEARFELQKPDAAGGKMSVRMVKMQFVGADPQAQIQGADELPGKVNYLIGNNPAHWRTGVETFARLRVEQLYPGVTLIYYGNQRQLEYDLTIAPGANPNAIQIRFDGVDKISIGGQGELILSLGDGEIRQPAPVIYQVVNGRRQAVSGGYRLVDAHTVSFATGKYDGRLPLVIDPVLSFSTYFGGNGNDTAWSVALDPNGFIYIAGNTLSSQFPTNSQPNGYQTNFNGGGITGDAFVAKFDNQGSNLIYFTYLGGGSGDNTAYALAVDPVGHAYVAGATDSASFPVTNAIPGGTNISGTINQYANAYLSDAFVTELETNGSRLIYSTYLGGGNADAAYGIALDSSNDAYVTGFTYSTNFPTTTNAFQKTSGVPNSPIQAYYNANAFVSEIAAGGSRLLYSTYLGGTNYDWGKGIAVDSSNYVYVTGLTSSTNFPTTNAIFQQFVVVGTNQVAVTNVFNGSLLNGSTGPTIENTTTPSDAFVTKFAAGFTNLVYSTFLGGTNNDVADGIAADGSGNAYVTGWTVSTNFPNTIAVSNLYNGLTNNLVYGYSVTTNVFLTQITNGSTAGIGFSAVFGGTNFGGGDVGNGVTLDPYGNIYVVGSSTTTNFPAVNTPGLLGTTNAGGSDVFVIAFSTNASAVLYSGYLGGAGNDSGYGIAVDSATNVYIVGQTASANFPVFNARQSVLDGPSDAFLAKIGSTNVPPQITTGPTNQATGVGMSVSLVVTATGTPPLTYQWQEQGTNLVWTNLVNGGNLSGATNATLIISGAQTTNSGSYQVIITNFAGSVTSSVAVLTITNVAPVITTQPQSQTVAVGSTVSFSVSGQNGTFPEFLQWFKDGMALTNGGTNFSGSGVHISGATNATLTINDVQTNDDGTYWLTVTNPWGLLTSSNAMLTVVSFPTIVTPPTNQTVGLGSTVTFTVTAVGTAPLGYQWQFDGMDLTDGTNANGSIISGSITTALTINNAQTNNDGGYAVIVTNSLGSVTSSPPAVLTVLTAPTFTGITAGTNGSFIFSGTGGTNGGTYLVYASTNLALPLNQWQAILVSGSLQFGSQGQFSFINTPPTNISQRFYILKLPSP